MKKFVLFVLCMIFIPFFNIDALECYKGVVDIKNDVNFPCVGLKGDTIKIKHGDTDEDITSKFKIDYKEDKSVTITILDKNITFDKNKVNGKIKVVDKGVYTTVTVKNYGYVKPTTTTTTTTTQDVNTKVLTVTLEPGNGQEVIKKTCEVKSNNTICSVTLPNLEDDDFGGWGTQKTCKEGKIGTIRVDKDITYYACYTNNTETTTKKTTTKKTTTKKTTTKKTTTRAEQTTTNPLEVEEPILFINSLVLKDKATEEEIDFGIFSIKKTEYDFKVLNNVLDIEVDADVATGIEVDITGNENLKVGLNTITITISDEDNNTKEYTLNVTRLEEGESISVPPYLKSLVIGGYEDKFHFDKEKFIYDLKISDKVDKLLISYECEDENCKVDMIGNNNLKNDSVITIKVSNENDETIEYLINVTKESGFNIYIVGAIALIVILLLTLIILIIVKKKSNKFGSTKPEKAKKTKSKEKTSKIKKTTSKNDNTTDNKQEEVEVLNI